MRENNMQVIYLLETQKKMGKLPETDFNKLKQFVERIKVCESVDQVYKITNPVKTKFEETEVFLARIDSHLRVVFTFKNGAVYLLSIVEK
jgi:DNA polymerase III sliding clamp (beta) subunit (PCNA family)